MSWTRWIPKGVPPVNYPFHVAKAIKILGKLMHFIDTVIVVVDARAPLTTLYKDFKRLFGRNRHVILVMGKADLAPKWALREWRGTLSSYGGERYPVFHGDLRSNASVRALREHLLERARRHLNLNVLVVGAPNLGKSTLINSLVGRRKARVGDVPGITRSLQWLKVAPQVKVLDSPGLMPPIPEDWLSYAKLVLLNVVPISSDVSRWKLLRLLLAYLCDDDRLREVLRRLDVIGKPLVRAGEKLLEGDEERALSELMVVGECWSLRDEERVMERVFRELSEGRRGRLILELPESR